MKKKSFALLLMLMMICLLCSCGDKRATGIEIEKNETDNQSEISASLDAMGGHTLAMQDTISWGIPLDDVKTVTEEPYIYDTESYLANAFYAGLPAGDGWKDKSGKILSENFITTDILAYYCAEASVGLYEYGYLAPNPNLHQYDFLKEYYTYKYGEPTKETFEWNDPNYTPSGEEDYYQMFTDGLVKVITVWDIEELDVVLVVDWLNDPQNFNNNYGQISFYPRSDGFNIDQIDETYNAASSAE